MFCLATALALGGALLTSQAEAAPITWAVNGHQYELFTTSSTISWSAARSQAQALGAGWDLATVTSKKENLFISSMLGSAPAWEYWLGGRQLPTAKKTYKGWRWVTGETWSFTNWAEGEPNDCCDNKETGQEQFLGIWPWNSSGKGWTWNDEGYANVRGFIAERHGSAAVPEPATLTLVGLGSAGLALARRRRRKQG
jgi:hypothetical protein